MRLQKLTFIMFFSFLFSFLNSINDTKFSWSGSIEEGIISYNLADYSKSDLDQKLKEDTFKRSITKMIQIPDTGFIKTKILNVEFINDNELKDLIQVGEPIIMRDLRVVPITFNLVEGENTLKSLELKIEVSDKIKNRNEKSSHRKISRNFSKIYESMILNYENTRSNDFQNPCYLFIHPDNDNVLERLQPLVDWKFEKGFEVHTASLTETGTGMTEIKDYIQNAYDNWSNPPEYICLVGDANGAFAVPTAFLSYGEGDDEGQGEGDHFYTLLEGDDIVADASIGRLSFSSVSELRTIVNKILFYEKNPDLLDTDWYNNALLVGDPNDSGISTTYTNMHIGETILNNYPDFEIEEVYDPESNFDQEMIDSINAGVSFFNYRGYQHMSDFHVEDILDLQNDFRLPIAVFITCGVGNFAIDDVARSEAFLRAGTASTPRGAIAAVATATSVTHTTFNNCFDAALFDGIFAEDIFHIGDAVLRGKYEMFVTYPSNPEDHVTQFSYWNNLMGDPGLEVWTGVPQEMNIVINSEVSQENDFCSAKILSENTPIGNALVTISNKENSFQESCYSDVNGNAILPLNGYGNYVITAIKHNFKPAQEAVSNISGSSAITISHSNSALQVGATQNVELTLTGNSGSEYVDVEVEAELFNDFAEISNFTVLADVLGEYGLTINFDITLEADVAGVYKLPIRVDFSGNNMADVVESHIVVLDIETPNIQFISVDSYKNISLNNKNEISLNLRNIGNIPSGDLDLELSSIDDRISLLQANSTINSLAINEEDQSNEVFEFEFNNFIENGTTINLDLLVSDNNNFQQIIPVSFVVGENSINYPTVSNDGEYFMFDENDFGQNVEYDWIEINQEGTVINQTDEGDEGFVETIDLPFTMKFYGETYDELTICSNGWISPGRTTDASFMNWQMPAVSGHSPMIAVFWDDLIVQNNQLYHYYDYENHTLIIQWDQVVNDYDLNVTETFQCIIYDEEHYPTQSGNNKIKLQYKDINNCNIGSYGVQFVSHGLYATIGIEDHTMTKGIQYTFNNVYPSTAKVLENEMAILITDEYNQNNEASFAVKNINSTNALYRGVEAEIFIEIENFGNESAENLSATLVSNYDGVIVNSNNSNYVQIPVNGSGVNDSAFNINISDDLDESKAVTLNLHLENNDRMWILPVNLDLYNSPIKVMNVLFEDFADQIPNNNENGFVNISLKNITNQNLSDVEVSLLNQTFGVAEWKSNEVRTFVPEFSTNTGDFDLEITLGESSFTENIDIIVEEENMLFSDDFTDAFNWRYSTTSTVKQNSILSETNYAGGGNGELYFDDNVSIYSKSFITSEEFVTYGTDINVEFSCFATNANNDLRIELLDENNSVQDFQNIENINANSIQELSIELENEMMLSKLRFTYEKNFESAGELYFDDLKVTNVIAPDIAYLYGEVELSSDDLNNVNIIAFNNEKQFLTSPDITGNYRVPCFLGNNALTVNGYGFSNFSELIDVSNNSEVEQNIVLEPLQAPTNLTINVEEYFLHLNWSLLEEAINYEIYESYNYNSFTKITDINTNSYVKELINGGNYRYFVIAAYANGVSKRSEIEEYYLVGIENDVNTSSSLLGNYPNPFNPETDIKFFLKESQHISIEIFNVKGQKIKTLVNKNLIKGKHSATWYGDNDSGSYVSTGIYFYRMKTSDKTEIKKMMLLK